MTERYVIAGCGYTGRRLAKALSANADVLCVTRSVRTVAELQSTGLTALVDDLGAPRAVSETANATVIYLAPPPSHGDVDTTITAYLNAIEKPTRLVYASTSGVYGDCHGELVDESRPVAPMTARAQRRVSAENTLQMWGKSNAVETVVLRVPGIYGPGRLPLDRIRRREAVLRREDAGPGNRIHVDDLVTALHCAATSSKSLSPINVGDGNHLSSTDFVMLTARLANLPAPPEIALEQAREEFSSIRWSFLRESRRLVNRRMLDELGVRLKYSDPADGISASL